MKRMVFLSAMIAWSAVSMAQYDDDYSTSDLKEIPEEISKGDNLVLIHTDRDADTNFVNFSNYLAENGYTFKSSDRQVHLLVTDPRAAGYGNRNDYMMNITFTGQVISVKIKQFYFSVHSDRYKPNQPWYEWQYRKSKGTPERCTFDDFYPVLKGYGYPVKFMFE